MVGWVIITLWKLGCHLKGEQWKHTRFHDRKITSFVGLKHNAAKAIATCRPSENRWVMGQHPLTHDPCDPSNNHGDPCDPLTHDPPTHRLPWWEDKTLWIMNDDGQMFADFEWRIIWSLEDVYFHTTPPQNIVSTASIPRDVTVSLVSET